MSRERIWVTADGREVKIKDMEDSHLVNSARWILRRGARKEYFKDLSKEINRRGLAFTYEGVTYDGTYITIERNRYNDKKIVAEQSKRVKTKAKIKMSYKINRRPKSMEVVQ